MAKKTDLPAKPHHRILEMEVTGGFVKGARLEFTGGFNCIIGGHGTAKTTLLELLRFGLGLTPDPGQAPAHFKSFNSLLQSNLGHSGLVRIKVCTRHGIVYCAERPLDEPARVQNDKGEPMSISFDRDLIFTADVYSQNEIERVATDPGLQLAVLDKFIEEDVRRVEGETGKLGRALKQNAAELVRLDQEIQDSEETASEIPALEEKLKGLQEALGPDSKAVTAAHAAKALREKEKKTLEGLRSDVTKGQADFESLAQGMVRRLEARIDGDVSAGLNKKLFAVVGDQAEELTRALQQATKRIGEQAEAALSTFREQEAVLADRHVKQDSEYRELLEKTEEESGRAAERADVRQLHLAAQGALKELVAHRTDRSRAAAEREKLLEKLTALRNERFLLRKKVAERLTEDLRGIIRVRVDPATNRETYRALLNDALKGPMSRPGPIVDKIVKSCTPGELVTLVERQNAKALADVAGLSLDQAQKVINNLRGTEHLYEIQTVNQEDVPSIALRDGDVFKESTALSTGQKCTAILPILLQESDRPLLIDQPEDNLDNKYIYEAVVKSLRETKGKRQIIFVTHSPSITVLGDAERVFVMTSDGKIGRVARSGTVEELKGEIELLLEGGREAFQERMERYGH